MNDFVRCNKVNGVYWLKNPIDALTINITTRLQDGVINLPKFEQYNTSDTNTEMLSEDTIDEISLKWQQKCFSRHEILKYSNVHNCVTDTELAYFELLENTQHVGKKIFTYVNEDCYKPLLLDSTKENQSVISYLNSCFGKMNLAPNGTFGRVFNNGSVSMTRLFRSNENLENEQWMTMHVLYDNSEYNDESQLLVKQELPLISLYYNVSKNYLILSPDTNNLTFNPYTINGDRCGLQYSIDIGYGQEDNCEELVKMLNKLYKKWEKKHKQLVNFPSPQIGKKKIYITFEIVSAKNYETDNIYVEFHIKVPDDIKCNNTLHGKTHTTSALKIDDLEEWKYGHMVDLEMEISTGVVPSSIIIYLEVISTDWWGRHRTEGYACLHIPLDPGWHSRTLTCVRPEEIDVVEAESRRFFVGGCHLIKDLSVLDNPSQSTNCRWTTTGMVSVRWRTVAQSAARGSTVGEGGADAALRRYHRAVATLAAARKLYTQEPDK